MSKNKIKTREELASICQELKKQGKTIGFSSGVFDLIHAGHIDFFSQCARECDVFIIGLNTDESTKRYKGDERPIVNENFRAITLAAIETVDYVFHFSERRNRVNIETLKPDFYFKAGDYSKSQLTSGEIIEKQGGQVKLIPIKNHISTTSIIEKILRMDQKGDSIKIHEATGSVHVELPRGKKKPAVFLDRDGTINEEIEYLHEENKFQLTSQAGEGLKKLQDMGYYLIIVTTQAGIGLGYFTHEDFYQVNRAMFRALKPYGVKIDKIYYCPHSVTENCPCRKPKTGLFEQAVKDLNIDLNNSLMIGDKTSDLKAAENFHIKPVLVETGHGGKDNEFEVVPYITAKNLHDAALKILDKERK